MWVFTDIKLLNNPMWKLKFRYPTKPLTKISMCSKQQGLLFPPNFVFFSKSRQILDFKSQGPEGDSAYMLNPPLALEI